MSGDGALHGGVGAGGGVGILCVLEALEGDGAEAVLALFEELDCILMSGQLTSFWSMGPA